MPIAKSVKSQVRSTESSHIVNTTIRLSHNAVYCHSQLFRSSILIMDIATYRLNQPRGQCSENHLKCITRWEGRDWVTITIFFQHTRDGNETSYLLWGVRGVSVRDKKSESNLLFFNMTSFFYIEET